MHRPQLRALVLPAFLLVHCGTGAPASDAAMQSTDVFDAAPASETAVDVATTPDVNRPDSPAMDAATPDTFAPIDAPTDHPAPPDDAVTTAIWHPMPGTSWQWQLSGTIDTSVDAAMYDIDLFDTPQSTIDSLHGAGRRVICYFSAGSREDWRPDANQYPSGSLGTPLAGWPGEVWVDTRDATVRGILTARMDLAVSKHCDGIEPDNVDAYANNPGFPLTPETQLDFNRFLATSAHARGLSVGLKNDLDQVQDLLGDFDWALNEQCFQYSECDLLAPFVTAGKAVFEVEYGDMSTASTVAQQICPQANAANFDSLVKYLDLGAFRMACR